MLLLNLRKENKMIEKSKITNKKNQATTNTTNYRKEVKIYMDAISAGLEAIQESFDCIDDEGTGEGNKSQLSAEDNVRLLQQMFYFVNRMISKI